jgi:hypothetical protein
MQYPPRLFRVMGRFSRCTAYAKPGRGWQSRRNTAAGVELRMAEVSRISPVSG